MPANLRSLAVRIMVILSIGGLGGCSGLGEIAQGSIDQFAAADQQSAPREVIRFQVPEDALIVRDVQLEQTLYELGRRIARGYIPKVRLTISVGRQTDAEWLLGAIDRGIASTGWTRPAVMVSPRIQMTHQYPAIVVEESVRS